MSTTFISGCLIEKLMECYGYLVFLSTSSSLLGFKLLELPAIHNYHKPRIYRVASIGPLSLDSEL